MRKGKEAGSVIVSANVEVGLLITRKLVLTDLLQYKKCNLQLFSVNNVRNRSFQPIINFTFDFITSVDGSVMGYEFT